MFSAALKSGAAPSGPTDPQFNYVTMLLHGDGTNGGQNNTFLDSSTNNFTITRNGNTTQGSWSPYGANWSNSFSGSDYFQFSGVATGTGTWTLEGWFYFQSLVNERALFSQGTSDNTGGFLVWSDADGTIRFYSNSNLAISSSGALTTSRWLHVAVVSNSSNITIYVNGTSVATGSYSGKSFNNSPFQINQGYGGTTSGNTCYISSARLVVGTAVYTSSFTPPIAPLTAISGTTLLTCQSNRFIDNSSNNYTPTIGGTPKVQRFSPFAPSAAYSTATIGGSGYFDGSGDYLSAPANAAYNFGSGDFTVEAWINPATVSGNKGIVAAWTVGSSEQWLLLLEGAALTFYWQPYSNVSYLASGGTVVANAWSHVAAVRSGNTFTLYLNGTSVASATSATTLTNSGNALNVGCWFNGSSGPFSGYICDARVVKGTAVYTTTFTPPTAPLTAITNTSVLCNMTNAAIFDNAEMNDLETVGNAQINTSVVKYGTGSVAFDGSGDSLKYLTNPLSDLGSGDFTIEFWINANSWTATTAYSIVMLFGPVDIGSGLSGAFAIDSDPTFANGIVLYNWGGPSGDGVVVNIPLSSVTTGVWYHMAFCRASGTTRAFLNGTSVSSSSKSYTGDYGSNPLYIGGGPSNGWFNGYIDDFRITKGYARYTSNFTPPTAAFPNK